VCNLHEEHRAGADAVGISCTQAVFCTWESKSTAVHDLRTSSFAASPWLDLTWLDLTWSAANHPVFDILLGVFSRAVAGRFKNWNWEARAPVVSDFFFSTAAAPFVSPAVYVVWRRSCGGRGRGGVLRLFFTQYCVCCRRRRCRRDKSQFRTSPVWERGSSLFVRRLVTPSFVPHKYIPWTDVTWCVLISSVRPFLDPRRGFSPAAAARKCSMRWTRGRGRCMNIVAWYFSRLGVVLLGLLESRDTTQCVA